MGNLTCSGDEVDIALCKFGGWGHTGHCVHSQDIAMTCGIFFILITLITFYPIVFD